MKRLALFLLTLIFSTLILPRIALALSPQEYAAQVIERDLPQTVRWFTQVSEASNKSQAEVYSLYQSALPEAQANHQQGISVKGSVDRMLLLLEGARYFEQIQQAPVEFQNRKDLVLRVLQGAKDQLDRTQFGEDPQVLLEEWYGAVAGMGDVPKFAAELGQVFTELQKRLSLPVLKPTENSADRVAEVDVVVTGEDPGDAATDDNFEQQRFSSYVQAMEVGAVADECQRAVEWKTDRSESCRADAAVECDRNYARQCKKLQ
jgi:hypothetical protein